MSTTHHTVVGKCKSLGACHGEKQSRARNPVFLRVWSVASGVAEVGSLFPRVRGSILERQVGVVVSALLMLSECCSIRREVPAMRVCNRL